MLPDYIYPSDNDYDIPLLLSECQAPSITIPFRGWGTQSRTKKFPGTYHCYVDDRHFRGLMQHPEKLVETECSVAIEPNFSCSLYTPRALVIEGIYWKRWINRVWQSLGVKTVVDVNVPAQFRDLVLLGVPHEWQIYATRGYSDRSEALDAEYMMCLNHCSAPSITFIVYAGGEKIKAKCQQNGWLYVPDDQAICRGKEAYQHGILPQKEVRPQTVGVSG